MREPLSFEDRERLRSESQYFEEQEYSREPLSRATIERYLNCRRPYLAAEYPYWVLGDLRGNRVLDVGCGDGTNAILLALRGATVVGIDLASRAIEAAKHRTRLHGLEGKTRFVCGPLETALEDEGEFDVITGFAVLHHLLPNLRAFLEELKRHGHSRTRYLFVEPVNLAPALRRLRLALPVRVSGTPGERPLERPELEILRSCFRQSNIKYFHALGRLTARFLLHHNYEGSARWRQTAYRATCRIDRALFDWFGLQQISSEAVICTSDV